MLLYFRIGGRATLCLTVFDITTDTTLVLNRY